MKCGEANVNACAGRTPFQFKIRKVRNKKLFLVADVGIKNIKVLLKTLNYRLKSPGSNKTR